MNVTITGNHTKCIYIFLLLFTTLDNSPNPDIIVPPNDKTKFFQSLLNVAHMVIVNVA